MSARIRKLAIETDAWCDQHYLGDQFYDIEWEQKFAKLIMEECINREALLGAIARGWCSEKNSHKTMDSDLAVAIFDEVEQQIKLHFGVKE